MLVVICGFMLFSRLVVSFMLFEIDVSLLCLCFSVNLVLYSLKTFVMVGCYVIYYGVCYEIVLSLLVDSGMDG